MAPAPPEGMIVVVALVVYLTPALSQRARGTRSAFGATFRVTLHDTCAAPDHENTADMKGFPHPGPLPQGERDFECPGRGFSP
jgi:hypothetical protein